MKLSTKYTGIEVAVIGIAGRFPGAENLEVFWQNLVEGVESISQFNDNELIASGVDSELLQKDNFVKAKGVFPGLESFDADFFNYTPKDASTMDPQVRALHEEVYHALENAGYASEQYRGSVGLFIGATNNFAWEAQTLKVAENSGGHRFATVQLNDKDYAATRIAYSLNLQGPSVTVHSACSTSLYAVDLACRNILTGACSLAVAGGSGLTLPSKNGYLYEEGMINSPDGHCRPFDKDAKGTVEGNGLGIVILKRLDAAIKDRDNIYAVIRGSAVNNDGNRKVGYTAPSIEGQAEVIRRALAMADVSADSISYIETHGTGTALGDPVEIAGLTKVFASVGYKSCGIGSLKSNIGHLDVAAGVSSFIKTVLALKHKTIPPSINFEQINPNIDMDSTPFRVITQREDWKRKLDSTEQNIYEPLRAGVSAFGIGGTNVHVVLEEAPEQGISDLGRKWKLLCLSAHTETAMRRLQEKYIKYLESVDENLQLSDLAWSLQTGQRNLKKRFTLAFQDRKDLIEGLKAVLDNEHAEKTNVTTAPLSKPSVYFLFPGQGTQYPGMARELYKTEVVFRKELDICFELAEAQGMKELRQLILEPKAGDEEKMQTTDVAQVSLFIIEYALARLLMSWGIRPAGTIGHSLGEYTAACLADVFTIEEGIKLVATRGQLMKSMPRGAMLAINSSSDIIRHLLPENVSLASVNSPNQCTVSGSDEDVSILESQLAAMGLTSRRLHTSHAFHSSMMEGAIEPFREVCASIHMKEPKLPYVSNVTGDWIDPKDAVDPSYYTKHLVSCVNFSDGIETILTDNRAVFIEIGPGRTLSTFVRQTAGDKLHGVVNTLRHPHESMPDDAYMVEKLGEMWKQGIYIDWKQYYKEQIRNRVPFPSYPFDEQHYPIDISEFYKMLDGGKGVEQPDADVQDSSKLSAVKSGISVGQICWETSFLPHINQYEQQRTCLVMTDKVDSINKLMGYLPRWRNLPVESGNYYDFKGTLGATLRNSNAIDRYRLFIDLRNRALLPDTIVIAYSTVNQTVEELRVLTLAVKSEMSDMLPEIVVLNPISKFPDNSELLTQVWGIRAENPELGIILLDAGLTLNDRDTAKIWASVLERELAASVHPYPAVYYSNGNRYVPQIRSLKEDELEGTSYFQTRQLAFLCSEDQLPASLTKTFGEEICEQVSVLPYVLEPDTFDKDSLNQLQRDLHLEQNKYLNSNRVEDLSKAHRLVDEYAARLCYDYVNGIFPLEPGRVFEPRELTESLGVVASLGRYVSYFIHIFHEDGLVEAIDNGRRYRVTKKVQNLRQPQKIYTEIGNLTPLFSGQLDLLEHCVKNFGSALCEEIPTLEVLYPEGKNDLLLRTYKDTIQEKEDDFLKELFASMLSHLAGQRKSIRILEAGSGYGSILRRVAPLLKGVKVEYYFTDVGKSFLDGFREHAINEEIDFLHFGIFDITEDPKKQGLEYGSFDLVFAYNVVHATHRLSVSLGNLQKLLKPGALLCVLERTRIRRYVDLIWGMADGWWHFDGTERELSPLVSIEEWKRQFTALGLEQVSAYPDLPKLQGNLDVGMIIGRQSNTIQKSNAENLFSSQNGVKLLPTVNAKDEAALEKSLKATLEQMADIEAFVLWDALGNRESRFDSLIPTVHQSIKAAINANHLMIQAATSFEKPVMVISVVDKTEKWESGLTEWTVAHEKLDSAPGIYRVYLPSGCECGTKGILAVLEMMLESGIQRIVIDPRNNPLYSAKLASKAIISTKEVDEVQGLEALLIKLWGQVLGRNKINLDDDFFELGGDSFKVIQMTVDLEREGYKVLMNEVFKYPTVRTLARYITNELISKDKSVSEPLQIEKTLLDTFGIKSVFRTLRDSTPINILFVDCTQTGDIDAIRRYIRGLKLPVALLPNYILPMTLNEKIPDFFEPQKLVELGVLCDSEKEIIENIETRVKDERRVFDDSIVSQPVTKIYNLSNIQKIHFRGEVRLQLYLIEFFEMVDEQLLEQAFCDVVGSHGLLRSCLTRKLTKNMWKEFAPPQKTPIPRLDLSGLTPEAQNRVMDTIAKIEWGADFKKTGSPMYHVMLIKLNEKRYDLFFQYDHSIFDVSSGQVIRRNILQRYRDLKNGVRKAMEISYSYQEFLEQVHKGPIDIDADGIISKFDLERYSQYLRTVKEKLNKRPSGHVRLARCGIDLTPFNFSENDKNGPFEIALQIHVLVVARLLDLDYVPFDLLFQNRRYQGKSFSDVVGLVLDGVPFLVPVDRENPSRMTAVIREKVELINKHNVNFLNLVWNIPTWWRWRKLRALFKEGYSTFYSPVLLNYAGNTELEYDKIWDYSMNQLDDKDQKKLNYADFYGLAKVMNNRLDFLILCKFEPDMERVQKIFDEEMDLLLKKYTEKSR